MEKEYNKYFEDRPPKRFKLAKFYNANKKYEKAEKEIQKIFKKYEEKKEEIESQNKSIVFVNPSLDDLYFELGKINFNQDKIEEALKNFKEANIINPLHATALFNASISLKKLGLMEDAAKLYKDAININPFLRETTNNILAEVENNEIQN